MLVLSRKEKQTILIGDDIEITICRVSGRRVTVGLKAPSHLSIRRGEIDDAKAPPPKHTRRGPLNLLCSVVAPKTAHTTRVVAAE